MRLKRDHGLSLIEATIVLMMISILTAAAAPAAKRTIDQARLTRAVTDEAAIKTAVVNFLTDSAYNGFSTSGVNVATGNAAVVETLVGSPVLPRRLLKALAKVEILPLPAVAVPVVVMGALV